MTAIQSLSAIAPIEPIEAFDLSRLEAHQVGRANAPSEAAHRVGVGVSQDIVEHLYDLSVPSDAADNAMAWTQLLCCQNFTRGQIPHTVYTESVECIADQS